MESVVLSGSPVERGRQFGAAFGDVQREHAGRRREPRGWPPFRYGAASARHLYYAQDHAPELVEELRGVAEGAGIGFEAAFHLTSQAALSYAQEPADACTNFAAQTSDAGPMLGKTEDPGTHLDFSKNYVLQKVRPRTGYRYVAATRKYNLWTSAAINEHGLAVGQSSGPLKYGGQDGSGINYLLLPRLVVERCRTAEEGVQLLGGLRMAGKGVLFMLVDAGGGIRAVEKWYDRQAVRTPSEGALYFANGFVAPQMQDFPPRYDHENAAFRMANLRALFARAQANGGYTARFMEQTLANHAPAGSICRHATDSAADGNGVTGPAFLFRCRETRVAVYAGRPCQVEPAWVGFDF